MAKSKKGPLIVDKLAHLDLVEAPPPGSMTIAQACVAWGWGPTSRNSVLRLVHLKRIEAVRVRVPLQPKPVVFITQKEQPVMERNRARPMGEKRARAAKRGK